jgi:hypothetical protein
MTPSTCRKVNSVRSVVTISFAVPCARPGQAANTNPVTSGRRQTGRVQLLAAQPDWSRTA